MYTGQSQAKQQCSLEGTVCTWNSLAQERKFLKVAKCEYGSTLAGGKAHLPGSQAVHDVDEL